METKSKLAMEEVEKIYTEFSKKYNSSITLELTAMTIELRKARELEDIAYQLKSIEQPH